MSAIEESIGQAPAPEAPPEIAPQPAPEAPPPDPKDRRAVVADAFKLASAPPDPAAPATNRGQHAKFQPRDDRAKFAPGPPQIPAQQPAARPEMPRSLKQEMRSHWDAAPPELLADFVRRDADYEKGARAMSGAKAQLDELMAEFRPYESFLAARGATPRTAIGPLMRTAQILHSGTPEQKAYAVAEIMRQYGIQPEHLPQQALSSSGPSPQPAFDPQVQQLRQQVQMLTAAQQRQSEDRALSAIRQFAADPAHPHFDAVSERMSVLLQNPAVLGADVDGMGEAEKLRLAYETAVRLDPELSKRAMAEQSASQQSAAKVAQARSAAVQVKGAPASGPAPKANPNDRRALIANAFKGATR